MLLQILEDGCLTDSQGRKVDFKNTVIIMTSNVGARLITDSKANLGFQGQKEDDQEKTIEKDNQDVRELVLAELKKMFRPEFLNRVDDIIVFHKLTEENIQKIAVGMLNNLKERLAALDIDITYRRSGCCYCKSRL